MGFLTNLTRRKPDVEVPPALLAGRPPLHAADFPLVLLFSEKAGCTSLTKWFFFQIGKLDEAVAHAPWVHRYRTEVFIQRSGYAQDTVELLKAHERPVIKLVRNPYERAVSSFLHTIRGASRPGKPGWEAAIVLAARERAGKPVKARLRLSFRDFLRHVAAVGSALGQINGHVARQYLPHEGEFITRVIRLENFETEIRQIEADFALMPSPLDRITTSRHHISSGKRPDGRRFAGERAIKPADIDFAGQRVRNYNVPAYVDFYDEETERLVHSCFADDFQHYGFARKMPGSEGA